MVLYLKIILTFGIDFGIILSFPKIQGTGAGACPPQVQKTYLLLVIFIIFMNLLCGYQKQKALNLLKIHFLFQHIPL
jgi:hypothetical protein